MSNDSKTRNRILVIIFSGVAVVLLAFLASKRFDFHHFVMDHLGWILFAMVVWGSWVLWCAPREKLSRVFGRLRKISVFMWAFFVWLSNVAAGQLINEVAGVPSGTTPNSTILLTFVISIYLSMASCLIAPLVGLFYNQVAQQWQAARSAVLTIAYTFKQTPSRLEAEKRASEGRKRVLAASESLWLGTLMVLMPPVVAFGLVFEAFEKEDSRLVRFTKIAINVVDFQAKSICRSVHRGERSLLLGEGLVLVASSSALDKFEIRECKAGVFEF